MATLMKRTKFKSHCSRANSQQQSKISSSPDYADIFVIVVPTQLNEKKEPNLEIIYSAIDSIIPFLNANNLLILESTCPVGTTEEIASYIFKKRKDQKGKLSISYCLKGFTGKYFKRAEN